jgi:hypothetical protein
MAIVLLYDIEEIEVSNWARNNCPSCLGWLIYENGDAFDNDPEWYVRYEFEFLQEQEAMLFQLRWQGQ